MPQLVPFPTLSESAHVVRILEHFMFVMEIPLFQIFVVFASTMKALSWTGQQPQTLLTRQPVGSAPQM